MNEYILHFKLTKHPLAKQFTTTVQSTEEKLDEKVELRTKFFTDLYGTPVKCVKKEKKQ